MLASMAAPRFDRSLTAARGLLSAEDWEGALPQLLETWRGLRHPRLAEVIDRVSERIVRPAVEAESVAARTEAWLALAAKGDPLDVARLLATPWPGTWTNAKPLLEALAGFDDPRVSMGLCRLLEATPYDTYKSSAFYRPLLRQIVRIGDLRAVPLLEADLERTRTSYWQETTRPFVMRARTELKKLEPPTLNKATEAALAALEALFAGAQTAARGAKKSEAELLEAIWASLDDDAPRAVYADFLMERGDPRGELIALQLRSEADATAKKRERALLAKHGKAWLGPLERLLAKQGRELRRGFLARGTLELKNRDEKLGRDFHDPCWNTLEDVRLHGWRDQERVEDLAGLPWFGRLRALRGLDMKGAAALASKGGAHLQELEIVLEEDEDERLQAIGGGFPAVRALYGQRELAVLGSLVATPLGARLTKLGFVDDEYPLTALIDFASTRPSIEELVGLSDRREYSPCWTITLRKDAQGAFTRVHVEPDVDATQLPSASTLAAALDRLPRFTEVVLTSRLGHDFSQGDLEQLEIALSRFADARIEVPWPRIATEALPEDARGVTLYYHFQGRHEAGIAAVLEAVKRPPLSLAIDVLDIDGKAMRELGKKSPLEATLEALAKKRTFVVGLGHKGDPGTKVDVYRDSVHVSTWVNPARRAAFLDWYVEASASTGYEAFATHVNERDAEDLLPPSLRVLWLVTIEPWLDEWIPFPVIEAAARRIGDGAIVARRVPSGILLCLGASPAEPPPREVARAFRSALMTALWGTWKKKLGFVPSAWLVEQLEPLLAKHGFTRGAVDTDLQSYRFVGSHPAGACSLSFETANEFSEEELVVTVRARQMPGREAFDFETATAEDRGVMRSQRFEKFPVGTKALASSSRKSALEALEKLWIPWFTPPPPPEPKRRRR